jgi:signal transduction histidine kinase
VRNLVENAVRYGKRARLQVLAESGKVLIQVDDDGPGIPPDSLPEIFKPFVRLEQSRSAETGGLGLGLAIAQGIVQSHGGELTITNRPEGGTRAQISLDRHK